MARFESGDVLLTTTIGEVRGEIVFGVVARNLAAAEFFPQLEAVQPGQRRCLGVSEGTAGIERAGEFDQHLTRNLRFRNMKNTGKQAVRQVDSHAHSGSLTAFPSSARRISGLAWLCRDKGEGSVKGREETAPA